MKSHETEPTEPMTRRRFLGETAVAAVGATAAMRGVAGGATPAEENPWRYDIDRLRRVDPARIGYVRLGGFSVGALGVRRLVWGGDGEILVAAGKAIGIYRTDGTRVGQVAVGDTVRAVALMADGRLCVGLRDRVEIFERSGDRVARWAPLGGKPFVTGVAIGEDVIFVADSGNRVVYRCDFQGRIQVRLGEKNPARGIRGLVLPSPFLDVELGGDGLVRITNPGRHQVEVYTPDGDLEASWGKPGVGLDGFCGCCNPIAVSLLSDGRVVTAEKGLPRVKVYSAAGVLETVVAGPDAFAPVGSDERSRNTPETAVDGLDVAVASDGRVAVLDLPGRTVQIFRPKGEAPASA